MNKIKSNSLLNLIRSTDKPEKMYINKYLARFISKEATATKELFELYCKKKEVNDEIFRIKLNLTAPIYANYKFQLYNLILKALSEHSKSDSLQSRILDSLAQIEVLYNKSLFRDALVKIKKTKELAIKHQEFRLIPQIIQWQIMVMQYITSSEKSFTDEKDILLEESIKYLDVQKNIIEYQQLKKDYQTVRSKFKDDHKELANYSKKLLRKAILQNENLAKSSLAKLHFHQLNYLINLKIDLILAFSHAKKMLSVLENELGETYISHNLSQYVDAHFNILVSACEMKNQSGFEMALEKIEDLEKKYEKELKKETLVYIFRSKYLLLAEHFHSFNATNLLISALPTIKEGVEKYENKIRTIIIAQIYFGIGNAFCAKKEYNKAILWYNKTLSYPKNEMFNSTFNQSTIMNLICHFETNYIHFKHILENAKKALKNESGIDKEKEFISYFTNQKSKTKPQSDQWPYLLWTH